jgi:Dna[CI] antecedent, DciA
MRRSNLCGANFRHSENVKIKDSPRLKESSEGEGTGVQQAGSGLEKIVAQSLRLAPRAEAPLMAWPVVCGSAVAERTRALSFSNGVLRVEVNGQRWKSELQALAPRYLAMINRYTTEPVLRIEFVVAQIENPSKKSF